MIAGLDFVQKVPILRDTIRMLQRIWNRLWNREGKCQDEQRPVKPRCLCRPLEGATPREHDRGRTFGRLSDDNAALSPRTMDPNQRRKSDDDGEATELRRNLRIFSQWAERRRGIVENNFRRNRSKRRRQQAPARWCGL